MADDIPAALRQADVTIFKCAAKAAQLQTVKPIVAYWCEYWVVNQVLAKQLHSTSEEVLTYTMNLMDKLEQTKSEYANEDAIVDDVAGQAYIEQFAQETLDRAERVVKANRVTQQTATTFDAAATFFHLVNIWGAPDEETQQKIKYAKWNAARIAKAIKEGRDPNESNPKQEEPSHPELDPNDPEARLFNSPPPGISPQPVTVEDAPDADLVRDAAGVSLPHTPVSASRPGSSGELTLPGVPTEIGQRPPAQPGYFDSQSIPPSPISPPAHDPDTYPPPTSAGTRTPPQTWTQNPPRSHSPPPPPQDQHTLAPPQSTAPPTFATNTSPAPAVAPAPFNQPVNPSYMAMAPTAHSAAAPAPRAAQAGGNLVADEAAMVLAQKHAKWAISALNFEDVGTAVGELRRALQALGAT
ncbi:vacuolar protein sorting-associated protein vts1 [Phialemonium atrogriseum]|uniref:Vacuolar protein sorting-associated protein vts1 n=1 Tax=Phialemonium atrogriseum TaxID=1093897 RepID=A0AAJ0FC20_9PEZI|nr:vacuolar protein sorting-associated protein vts1 [Phialemonium atrogriseum]KAK1763121.1 vacuolar protein sorting-associated protein vts1 [Phialemonium atrogriseum]